MKLAKRARFLYLGYGLRMSDDIRTGSEYCPQMALHIIILEWAQGRARVRACVRACVRAGVRVCVCVCVCSSVYGCA